MTIELKAAIDSTRTFRNQPTGAAISVQIESMEEDQNSSLDEDFPLGDGVADMETMVVCPYCGEEVEIAVDPGGGSSQAYVEDCSVCCSPWMVHVQYSGGDVSVSVEQTDA